MTLRRILRIARLRWRSLTRPAALDAEFDREMAFHVDQLVQERTSQGVDAAAARAAALRAVGNVAVLKERSRDHRRLRWLHDAWDDVRYGARQLRARPLFTAVAVTSLAIGIGANATVLSAIDRTLRRPLPLREPDRLVVIRSRSAISGERQERDVSTPREFAAWKTGAHAFDTVEASVGSPRDFGADESGPAARIDTRLVSSGWFDTLGVQPLHGRHFTRDEYRWAAPSQVMVISHALWRDRYGMRADALHSTVRVNGVLTTIVGIMPPDFTYQPRQVQAWLPLRLNPAAEPGVGLPVAVIGRLRSNVPISHAQAELDGVSLDLAARYPDRDWRARAVPMGHAHREWARQPLWSLQIAVAGLLLAVCANLAGHLLARNASRRHEIAVRYALGAGRGRIVRQFLIESTMLAAAGAVAGTIVAWSALGVVGRVITPPLGSPPLPVLELDGALFATLFAMATASALAFGVLPALGASRQLRRAAGVTLRKRHQGLSLFARGTLVAMQIAVSLLLLLGAGAAVQTFVRLASFDLGFDARRLILFQFTTSQPSQADILARVRGALAAIDGVESVAGVSDWSPSSLALPRAEVSLYDGTERDGRMRVAAAKYFLVTPGFFSTMKTPVLQGREFRDGDAASAPGTVVVNETAARQFWPGQNAIGKRLTLQTTPRDRPREVIGIVRDLPLRRQQVAAEPILYVPYSQHPAITPGSTAGGMFGRMTFVVRHRDGLDRVIGEAQRVVAAIDPYRPIVYAGQAGQLGQPLLELRNYGLVLAALAAAAAVLAVLGLYSALAHWVSERRKEIGVRLSLGARPSEIVRLVLGPALTMLTTGLVLGTIGMFIAPKPVALQTWRIETSDGITFAAAVAIVVTTALAGCLVPARHAARIDPSSALRVE